MRSTPQTKSNHQIYKSKLTHNKMNIQKTRALQHGASKAPSRSASVALLRGSLHTWVVSRFFSLAQYINPHKTMKLFFSSGKPMFWEKRGLGSWNFGRDLLHKQMLATGQMSKNSITFWTYGRWGIEMSDLLGSLGCQ